MSYLPLVIDNGTGYTKMGFAGNLKPQFIIPTAITLPPTHPNAGVNKMSSVVKGLEDLDYLIGKEAIQTNKTRTIGYPIRHGQIEDWQLMESFWHSSFYGYLRCDPKDHLVLLTEPPMNAPENREQTAEIMFETFNVPGLYIAVQAVLALAASWRSVSGQETLDNPLSGTVVDSGDGVTHIIPVIEGYVVPSAIKHVPIGGKDITKFIQQMLRERGEQIPSEESLLLAQSIKEQYGYVASTGLRAEFHKFDQKIMTEKKQLGKVLFSPEGFFHPEILSSEHIHGLPVLLDNSIQACPIDGRRSLYKNVVLSGGSTLFPNFSTRLERELNDIVQSRLSKFDNTLAVNKQDAVVVKVKSHEHQRHAVWSGGALMASLPDFSGQCVSREEYSEKGPASCRQSRILSVQ